MIRVALVAPMRATRAAVRAALEVTDEFGVVAEGGPDSPADLVRYSSPDVLIISHAAEGEALRTLLRLDERQRRRPPANRPDREKTRRNEPGNGGQQPRRTACLVLADRLTGHGTRQLLRQGAAGVLRRGTAAQHLPWAVTAAAMGSLALDPGLTDIIRSAYARSAAPCRDRTAADELLSALSPREQDVLALVCDGLSNREIAQALCLSPDTVKEHLRRACVKLGVENRLHAARVAWQAGIGAPHC